MNDFPAGSRFLGYAVHRQDTDDFLMKMVGSSDATLTSWTPDPSLSKIFSRRAVKTVAARLNASPVALYDSDERVFVTWDID